MKMDKVREYLKSLEEEYGVPFWQCRIVYQNQVVLDEKSEHLDESKKYYYIYSMTKLVTAVAVMQLAEAGKLSLEDKVSKYLPEFEHLTVHKGDEIVEAKKALTVKHLISMQGGYDYNVSEENLLEEIKKHPNATTREVIRTFAKRPLWFEPGEGFAYSLCYDVLGAVIEVASGQRLGDYFKEKIFLPLGMKDTGYRITEEVKRNRFPLYQYDEQEKTLKEVETTPVRSCFTPEYESGGAGLYATFEDYFKFTKAILEGELLSEESLKLMYQQCMTEKMLQGYDRYQQWGCGYCLSLKNQVDYTRVPAGMSKDNFEISGAAGAYAFWDLKYGMAVQYFQNVVGIKEVPNEVHHKIRDLVYEEIAKNGN